MDSASGNSISPVNSISFPPAHPRLLSPGGSGGEGGGGWGREEQGGLGRARAGRGGRGGGVSGRLMLPQNVFNRSDGLSDVCVQPERLGEEAGSRSCVCGGGDELWYCTRDSAFVSHTN
jgi:hypothetical protein